MIFFAEATVEAKAFHSAEEGGGAPEEAEAMDDRGFTCARGSLEKRNTCGAEGDHHTPGTPGPQNISRGHTCGRSSLPVNLWLSRLSNDTIVKRKRGNDPIAGQQSTQQDPQNSHSHATPRGVHAAHLCHEITRDHASLASPPRYTETDTSPGN